MQLVIESNSIIAYTEKNINEHFQFWDAKYKRVIYNSITLLAVHLHNRKEIFLEN